LIDPKVSVDITSEDCARQIFLPSSRGLSSPH
jgi:hypothetical protein